MEKEGVVDYMYVASIWVINYLADIVISVKILRLKLVRYIAVIKGLEAKISQQI